jgi:hypothetical protein
MVNYAVGQVAGRVMPIREAIFVTQPSNAGMLRYAKRLGAYQEPTDLIFRLELP